MRNAFTGDDLGNAEEKRWKSKLLEGMDRKMEEKGERKTKSRGTLCQFNAILLLSQWLDSSACNFAPNFITITRMVSPLTNNATSINWACLCIGPNLSPLPEISPTGTFQRKSQLFFFNISNI